MWPTLAGELTWEPSEPKQGALATTPVSPDAKLGVRDAKIRNRK